jgi:hypothetical protein
LQMQSEYPSHKSDKDFMYGYLSRLTALRLPTAGILDDYIGMLTVNEQADPKNIQLIVDNGTWLNHKLCLGIAFETLNNNKNVFRDLEAKKLVHNETLQSIRENAMSVSLQKAIEEHDGALFLKVQKLKSNAMDNPFSNKQTVALQYYYGIGDYPQYKALASRYVNGVLFKISGDSLKKWDNDTYLAEKAYIEKQHDPQVNKPGYLESYRHTQTIQVTNALRDVCRNMISLSLTLHDIKELKAWSGKIVNIAKADTVFYKYVLPGYIKVYAIVLYKAGERQNAMKEIRSIAFTSQDESTRKEYLDLLEKMRNNKLL